MFVKLLQSVQSYVTQYPSALEYVGKAIRWVAAQPFAPDLSRFWNSISFTVNFGNVSELNVSNFVVTKSAGSSAVFGSTAGNSRFELSWNGFVQSAKDKVSRKQSDASQKAAVARQKAEEAQRLAAEAARLAELAEAEADTFSSALRSTVGAFSR